MLELIKAILCIATLFGIYLLLVIVFERYLGVSLLFSTSHRGAKKMNDERRQTAVSVEKFSRENPEIFKQILIDIKKKRFAKIPENYDLLIRRYIKNNPTWADAEYNKAMAIYNKKQEIIQQTEQQALIKQKEELINSLLARGLTLEEAENFIAENDFLTSPQRIDPDFFKPQKKSYSN